MDSPGGQEPRERSYRRAPSRASTASAAHSQMTSHSTNSSSSRLRESTHAAPHTSHRYHHSSCSDSPVGGHQPISRMSSKPSDEFRKSAMSTSALLQEKLQQARNEMQAAKLGGDLVPRNGDVKDQDVPNSPIKSATAVGRRQQMPDFSYEPPDAAGMGARQMEQVGCAHHYSHSGTLMSPADLDMETLSTLHKQNFDLKVEVYHRRVKQVDLEDRVDQLESERGDMESIIMKLESRCDEKDKVIEKMEGERAKMLQDMVEMENAIMEAVRHIVGLEGRIDEMNREREMVRQVETDGAYRHLASNGRPNTGSVTNTAPSTSTNLDIPLMAGEGGGLGRVPSFLSEHSRQTENLRNAVLKGRSSVMHLRKVSESDASSPSEINRIASPSFSVLSESSFVSIYGPKEAQDKESSQPSNPVVGMDGSHVDRSPTPTMKNPNQEGHNGGARLSTKMQSLNNVLDMTSPLQKITRLEGQMAVTDDTSRQHMPNRSRGIVTPTPAKPLTNPPQKTKSKQEKREALQKVLTNYPTHRDFSNPQAFPPTPDTVSSSTLRKHQNLTSSQDSLSRPTGIIPGEALVPVHERIGAARESAYQTSYNQQAPATSFSGRRQIPMPLMGNNPFSDLGQLARSLPPRPHSSAETTSSRARANSFESDSDSDGGADARSEAPTVDYWLRESMRPNKQHESGRSTSPDLFSFPADARGWETDVIFGALRGNGYLGSPVSALKRDPLDEMASSLRTPQAEVFDPHLSGQAPPTPDRRSSLHARTGSASAAISTGGKFRKSLAKGPGMGWMDGKGRSNSIDAAAQAQSNNAYAQQQEATPPGKRNPYPPLSGQTPQRRGLGLNSLFRRSGSESYSVPSSATEANFPIPNAGPAQPVLSSLPPGMKLGGPAGRSSVPPPSTMPWRPPGVVEDDFKSATPPPIMRNRGMSLISGSGFGGAELPHVVTSQHQNQMSDMPSPSSPTTVMPAPKRKWLGLGKMGGLKKS
ncbi:uncharacterized protein F4807DRAFT_330159 [Annulohypoxylon truncatum]|uniref:uncharacterized protein n=1 Tax=Annulohypoxylon truncatum TaxID=327061 RepID=UPI002007F8F1|nr:uncharacterized protein F4807DRAFT_330159 [Annulohypoxylon truncatum]KAI1204483.1 hypothetical protein F4807DRAFT_330159 [Annulohypoxylon truncatum]